jgi:cobalt-zinc-cadmium efflux system membrane fusion protein
LDGKSVVFTPGDNPGEFQPHPVQVGAKRGDRVEIRSGLRAGERIVTRNAFLIKSQAMKGQMGDEDEKGQAQ